MWYAIEFAPIVQADVYEFSSRRLRDAWVADCPPSARRERRAVSARHPLVRSTPERLRIDGDDEAWWVLARERVENDPHLAKYADVCLYEDWGTPDHWSWLATAPASEIASWAEAVEKAAE